MSANEPIDYLSPDTPQSLPRHQVPLIKATPESLQGYGQLVDDYRNFELEIVTWPAPGWRPVDAGTGNEAGTTYGRFGFWWEGDKGLYIHPNIWHEGVFPLASKASFYDEQGKVHARISCNIAQEFGVFLAIPLDKIPEESS